MDGTARDCVPCWERASGRVAGKFFAEKFRNPEILRKILCIIENVEQVLRAIGTKFS